MGDLSSGHPDAAQPCLGTHTTHNQRACGRPRPETGRRTVQGPSGPALPQSELWGAGRGWPVQGLASCTHTSAPRYGAMFLYRVASDTVAGPGSPRSRRDDKDH